MSTVSPKTGHVDLTPEIAERRSRLETEVQQSHTRAKEAHQTMQTTECEGEIHVFKSEGGPGTTCACGKTVWIQPKPRQDPLSTVKGTGPRDVNEELKKGA